jgi:hypothetical protein
MFSLQRVDKPINLVFWIFFICPFQLAAQSFQNGSLESWGPTTTCEVNIVPDGWLSFSNGGQNLDECDFSICASTIPAQASEGNSYGRAYAATLTSGEGLAQEVQGFIVGDEYEVSFDFAGSNLLPGSDNCRRLLHLRSHNRLFVWVSVLFSPILLSLKLKPVGPFNQEALHLLQA